MRISDNQKYRLYLQNISRVSEQMQDIQTKVATKKMINTPSDDPIKYATNVKYDATLGTIAELTSRLTNLVTLSSVYDTTFSAISDQLATISNLANNAATMDDDLLRTSTQNIEDVIETLVDVANSTFGDSYIFGGQQADTAPFQLNSDYSVTHTVDETAEDAINVNLGTSRTGQYGISGREAFYDTSKIAYGGVDNTYTGEIYSTTENFRYVIDTSNNTINVDGSNITLTSGAYTGATLAQEIKSQLGASDYSVTFDSTTRKFVIANNSGGDTVLDWSVSNAADTLGFDAASMTIASGATGQSDYDSGRISYYVRISTAGSTTGSLTTERARYEYSTDGATWSPAITVSTGGADNTADITIGPTNNTFYVNGSAVTLSSNTYTGEGLATEIEDEILSDLGLACSVSYDSSTRKFSITNNTGSSATFNWSNPLSTAAGVLGFENVDSVVSDTATDSSDYDAGMFIDGSGIATVDNRGLKLAFSTSNNGLIAADTFQIEDLSVFGLLTNYRHAFKDTNTGWISQNLKYLDDAEALITRSTTVTAYQGVQAEALLTLNNSKTATIEEIQSELVDADTATLGVQLSVLTTTYETLMAAMSKALSLKITDYLG